MKDRVAQWNVKGVSKSNLERKREEQTKKILKENKKNQVN
jgi:hypothetical protein